VVIFDIETTGLSGGAGTLPLIAGCGWFEDGAFRVRQFFLNGPGGEHALLDALTHIFDAASLLVTYNGRTFDVPVMETRWAYHRQESPADALPHFDMLPAARRLWGGTAEGCALTALERSVLRFHRLNDVPGLEIPSRYFQFLRTGDPSVIEGVLEHNRHDVISTAAVMAWALRLAADGPEACETAREQLGLARVYENAGDFVRAEQAYGLAAADDDAEIAAPALARLAGLLRRQSRFQESAAAWRGVLALSSDEADFKSLQRRATEALAIHHEHRARDLDAAWQYAETLRDEASGRWVADAERRLGRLNRKMKSAEGRERPLL
jgi:tetratricopeptide (TPR) repeat protein